MNIVHGSKLFKRLTHYLTRFNRQFSDPPNNAVFGSDIDGDEFTVNRMFAINLDRQVARWKNLKKEARFQKVSNGKTLNDFMERISAVDGGLIKVDSYESSNVEKLYNLKEHFFIDPDPRLSHLVRSKDIKICMSPAEIAVALSHINIWKKMIDEKIPYALILEDDVFFERDFSEKVNKAWKQLPTSDSGERVFDMLYLSFKEVDNNAEKSTYSRNLFRPIRGFWWLSGYVLSYEGAKKLIGSLPVCGPVDMWINLQFERLEVFATDSSIISQRRDLESDNSYSIMPILSRVGIHLENNDARKSPLERKPIFAIGLNKTGTTSLHFALTLLGYKCCHWISDTFSDETGRLISQGLPQCRSISA